MPFSDPNSTDNPTTGQPILAAWGDIVRDDLVYLATSYPHCSVYNSGTQSVNDNTLTKLTADSEVSDVGGMHSTVTNTSRITIPASEGGLYQCSATVSFAADADGERLVRFLVDNTTAYPCQELNTNTAGSQTCTVSGLRVITLAAASYVEVQIRHTAGAALDVTFTDFSVRWIATA